MHQENLLTGVRQRVSFQGLDPFQGDLRDAIHKRQSIRRKAMLSGGISVLPLNRIPHLGTLLEGEAMRSTSNTT